MESSGVAQLYFALSPEALDVKYHLSEGGMVHTALPCKGLPGNLPSGKLGQLRVCIHVGRGGRHGHRVHSGRRTRARCVPVAMALLPSSGFVCLHDFLSSPATLHKLVKMTLIISKGLKTKFPSLFPPWAYV